MSSEDLATFLVAGLMWIAFAYKLRHARQRADDAGGPALRVLAVVLGLLAATFTITPLIVIDTVDRLTGVPGLTRFIISNISMSNCLAIIGWQMYLRDPAQARERMRFHTRVLIAALVVMAGLFAVDHRPTTSEQWIGGTYAYLYLLYVDYAIVILVRLAWQYAAITDSPLVRVGQRMVSIGGSIAVVGMAVTVVDLISQGLHLGLPMLSVVTVPVLVVAGVLFVTGMTVPGWGRAAGLEALAWRITRYLATRRLRSLWNVVTTAYPGVIYSRAVLAASPYGDRMVTERLPVEIHDGWIQLRFYLHPGDLIRIDDLADQHKLTGSDRTAKVAAARLMTAITRYTTGGQGVDTPPVNHLGTEATDTLIGEVRFLCQVSKALHTCFVRQAVADLPHSDTAVAGTLAAQPH